MGLVALQADAQFGLSLTLELPHTFAAEVQRFANLLEGEFLPTEDAEPVANYPAKA